MKFPIMATISFTISFIALSTLLFIAATKMQDKDKEVSKNSISMNIWEPEAGIICITAEKYRVLAISCVKK